MLKSVFMKMKKKNAMFALLIAVMLCIGLGFQSISAVALTRTVGVHVGDSAEYSVFAQGNATLFNATNMPTIASFTVTGINGTNVTCGISWTFANSTQKTGIGHIDVETGEGNFSLFIIAADLNAGDLVYNGTGPFTTFRINETTSRSYLGSNAEVNHMNLTTNFAPFENSSQFENCFWFRDSGLLAELIINITYVQGGVTRWMFEHLVITGTIPEFPVNMILPLFVFFSTLAVVTAKKKLFKPT